MAATPALPQGTLHRQRPETETTDSSGNLKNNSGPSEGTTVRGSVVLPDKSVPQQLVSIYVDCGGVQTLVAIADAKGVFSFNRGALDVVEHGKTCMLRPFLEGYRSEKRQVPATGSKNPKEFDKLLLQPLTTSLAGLTAKTDAEASKAQRKNYEKGLDEAAKGELANAITLFQKAISAYPDYSSAWFSLGIVQQNRGDKTGAEKSFHEAIRADPEFALPLIRLAELELAKGDWRESASHSEKAIEINPAAFPDAYALNAMANVSLQDVPAAEKSAREGLKLDTDHQYPELDYSLGIVLYAKGDTENAAKFLASYLSHVPNGPNSEAARNELSQIQQVVSKVSSHPAGEDQPSAPSAAKPDISGPSFESLQKVNIPIIRSTPTHTCLETIARAQIDTQGKIHDSDLTRVQIAVSEGKEIYGYVDGKRFSNERLADMLGYTFSTTGLFSSIARQLMSGSGGRITFAGKEALNSEPVLRYGFRFLASELPWSIDFGKESGVAGEEGSFFVETSNLRLRRVVLRATDMSKNLKLRKLNAIVDYEMETIAERRVLLPHAAQVQVEEGNGTQRVSRMFFNHCRSFTTEAKLSFEDANKESAENEREVSLPPDVNISIALQSPISAAAAVANDRVTATLAEPVVWKHQEVISAGAAIEGHVLPLHGQPGVTIEFDRIQMKSGWAPFYARLVSLNGIPQSNDNNGHGLMARGIVDARATFVVADPEIPGVAKIDLPNGTQAELPAGTRMTWKTEPLAVAIRAAQPDLSTAVSMH